MKELIGDGYQFPDIFITGEYPEGWTKESLIADGLCGWGCCMAGSKPPEKFGVGMTLISKVVGTALPEGLSKLADEMILKKQENGIDFDTEIELI